MPQDGAEVLTTGEVDAFGHVRLGGVGTWLAGEIERVTERETRAVVLGHTQRGGTPTSYDRVLSTRFGLEAIAAVHDRDFGKMVALRGTDIVRVPLSEATAELKTVPPERYAEAGRLLRLSTALTRRATITSADFGKRSCSPRSKRPIVAPIGQRCPKGRR